MNQLIEANQAEALLEIYNSISVRNTIEGELYATYYATDTYSYEKRADFSMYMTDNMGYGYQNGEYVGIVYLTRDGLVDYTDYRADKYADVIMSEESLSEEIQFVEETGKQITVTTFMSEEKLKELVVEESLQSLETTYVIDAETYDIMTISGTLTHDDGTTTDVLVECSYNEEMPEEINDFLEYENQTENLRTVTLVFHVGTNKEKTEYIQVPKGISLWLLVPDDVTEGFSAYSDAACTVPHQSNGDYTSDVTVYIK